MCSSDLLDIQDEGFLRLLAQETGQRLRSLACNEEHLMQFAQVTAWLNLMGIPISFLGSTSLDFMPPRSSIPTRLETEVEEVLAIVCEKQKYDRVAEAEIRSIHHYSDFLLYSKATKKVCVIEVDGPSHYNQDRKPLGATLLRNRLIEASRYKLVCIPYYEWGALKTSEERLCYVEEKLGDYLMTSEDPC